MAYLQVQLPRVTLLVLEERKSSDSLCSTLFPRINVNKAAVLAVHFNRKLEQQRLQGRTFLVYYNYYLEVGLKQVKWQCAHHVMTWRILNSIESIAQPLVNNMIAVWVFLFHVLVLVIGSSRGKNVKLGYSTLANLCHFAILSVKPEVWQTLHGCGCSQPKLLYCCNVRKVYNLCLRSPQVRKNCVSVCVCTCGQKSTPGCLATYRSKKKNNPECISLLLACEI